MLKYELDRFDDRTFYIIQEVLDDGKTKDHIDITNAHAFKTIYSAFMAHPNLGVNISNRKKKYAIYYCNPRSEDILIPYHFENESAWYTGEVVIYRTCTFHHLCTGYLEYERSVFTYEDNTDFAYLTFTIIPEIEEGLIIHIKKRNDFDLNNLVKGHFTNFWFIRNTSIIKNN